MVALNWMEGLPNKLIGWSQAFHMFFPHKKIDRESIEWKIFTGIRKPMETSAYLIGEWCHHFQFFNGLTYIRDNLHRKPARFSKIIWDFPVSFFLKPTPINWFLGKLEYFTMFHGKSHELLTGPCENSSGIIHLTLPSSAWWGRWLRSSSNLPRCSAVIWVALFWLWRLWKTHLGDMSCRRCFVKSMLHSRYVSK